MQQEKICIANKLKFAIQINKLGYSLILFGDIIGDIIHNKNTYKELGN